MATNDIVYDIKTTILEFYGKKRATFTLNFMALLGYTRKEKAKKFLSKGNSRRVRKEGKKAEKRIAVVKM